MSSLDTADISVILCAYTEERYDALLAAVASVQQQTLLPTEIVLVIDHNRLLYKRVKQALPAVRVIENTQTRGLSGARNSGILAAKGHFLAFLDDDAMAEPHWLQAISECFRNKAVLGVGGTVLPLWLEGCTSDWLPEEFYWVLGCTYRGMPRSTTIIRNPIGANMAFRREVFDEVGGFRTDIGRVGALPLGCEETELCIRARQHWTERVFLYRPEASVSHRVSPRRTKLSYYMARCYAEGRSKAVISGYVGAKDSLASEYKYVRHTLPLGILRNLVAALWYFKFVRIQRAMAIVLGLAMTTLGYLVGRVFTKNVGIIGDAPSVTALDTVVAELPETFPAYAALNSSSTQKSSGT
jgi:GT2 family glycosyltransferase